LSCNFVFGFNNGFNICVLRSGGNGKWSLHTSWFFSWQGCYDGEVGFHINLQAIKICQKLYIYQQMIVFHHYYWCHISMPFLSIKAYDHVHFH
jgi:hypothetical protein